MQRRLSKEGARPLIVFILIVLSIFYLLLLLQYIQYSPFAAVPVVDGHYYWQTAIKVMAFGEPLPTMFFSAPLYPLILMGIIFIIGPNLINIYVAQMIVALSCIYLIYRLGSQQFSVSHGVISALLTGLYFPFSFYALKVLPEVWSIFFLTFFLFLYTNAGIKNHLLHAVFLGLVGGLSIFARSQFSPLIIPLIIYFPFYKFFQSKDLTHRKATLGASAVFAMILPILLWSCYGWVKTGVFRTTPPNGGLTFYEGNNAASEGTYTPIPGIRNDVSKQLEDMVRFASENLGKDVAIQEADHYFWRKGFDYIISNPLDWLSLVGTKAKLIWNNREIGLIYSLNLEKTLYLPAHRLFPMAWSLLISFALFGCMHTCITERSAIRSRIPILWSGIVLIAVLLIFFVATRYRILLLPIVTVLASHGVIAIFQSIKSKDYLSLVLGVALISIGLYLTFTANTTITRKAYNNLGYALIQTDRFKEAESLSKKLWRTDPNDHVALINLISALVYQHDYRNARKYLSLLSRDAKFKNEAGELQQYMNAHPEK